jgi:hypothetical protein
MKTAGIFVLLAMATLSGAASVDPIEKVLSMLSDLQAKITSEGTAAQKVYEEFAEFCEDRSRNVGFEIKTGKAGVKDLDAEIAKEAATAESLSAKIEEIAAAISTDEADLKAATDIRTKEQSAFAAEEKELTEVIGTLERAISIIEKEMSKGGASMMQMKSAASVAQALTVMVQATSLSSADASKLSSLLQSSQESEDDSEELGAPAAAVYTSASGGIVGTLQDLFEKAEGQLADARKAENKALQAYQMLAASLKDEIKYASADMAKAKKDLGASQEGKASAEGDLAVTSKDLAEDISTLATLHQDCMKGAEDFEAETKSRGEELHALSTAKKVITEATSGAAEQAYSFLQVERSELSSGADLANFEAVRFVRDLARKQGSSALAQLASRMAQAMRSHTADPFAKVKSLIKDMIEKLLSDAQADATEHAFCTKEMAETEAKKSEKEASIEKLNTKIDSMSAKSANLKEQVAELEKELAALARTQAEADGLRSEEKAAYDTNSAEMEKGVKGVQLALKVLNEYYAKEGKSHSSADGAGSGIIGLLEVVESDFSKGLAEMNAAESSAVSEYEQLSKANDIEKATKSQSVKYKTKEFKGLDKSVTETSGDKSTEQQELDAVLDYYKGLKGRCVAKAETHAERTARREAEIAGLKEAMSILSGEAVLLQRQAKKSQLRR